MMASGGEEYDQYYGPRGAPHGLLMAVVLGLVIAGPVFLGDDGGEAVKEAMKELLGPVGLLLLPVCLVIVIRVLSSDRGAAAFANVVFNFGGTADTVHRAGGSPVGVALLLLVIVMLLYYRSALFGGGDDE